MVEEVRGAKKCEPIMVIKEDEGWRLFTILIMSIKTLHKLRRINLQKIRVEE